MADGPVQRAIERGLFASRFLVVPFYLGLGAALLMLFVVFVQQILFYVGKLATLDVDTAILAALTLIDLGLVANLVVIVALSSYETMVSKIDTDVDRPGWMGALGFADVKQKLFTSIVAISGIQLLKLAMGVDTANPPSERALLWLVVVHLTFVLTTLLSAGAEWVAARGKSGAEKAPAGLGIGPTPGPPAPSVTEAP
ncbi:YqhA family protein [Thermaurantiacus sp.]